MWSAQGVTKQKCFLREFKQILTDVFGQDWMASINSSERFIQYRRFKLVLEPEKYLDMIRQKCFKDAFMELRLDISDAIVHKNRYKRNYLHVYQECAQLARLVFLRCRNYQKDNLVSVQVV